MVSDVEAGTVPQTQVLSTGLVATWAQDGSCVLWSMRHERAALAITPAETDQVAGGGVSRVVAGGDER